MGYHFIGIGGIGMSSLAKILLIKKFKVKGSDNSSSAILDTLKKKGAKIFIGHKKENILEDDIVVYSSAITNENEELAFAKEKNIKVLHRSDLLNELIKEHCSLAICGTHGKTTTTSLLTQVLIDANSKPTYSIGGILNATQTNADVGSGKFFVLEADESDGSFLKYAPNYAIMTNVEEDHLDYWKSLENLKKGFSDFAKNVKNNFFWCKEDKVLNQLNLKGISYGFSKDAMLIADNVRLNGFSSSFDVSFKGKIYKDIVLNLAGKHMVLNALAVFGLALEIGIKEEAIRYSLACFRGVKRRMDKIGECNKTCFYDDYAHHPTEIKAVLKALRNAVNEKKILAVFQPHRFTRTKDLLEEFANAFKDADHVLITDIYSAGESPIENISSKNLVQKIKHPKCSYLPREDFLKIKSIINPLEVVIFLGAGDITKLGRDVFNAYQKKPSKIKLGLIFGGKSPEHESSILSSQRIYQNLDRSIYDINVFGITKEGKWQLCTDFSFKEQNEIFPTDVFKKLKDCDVCLPILHGPWGEDGMVQGFLDTLNIAYSGPSYPACSCGMNKAWVKYIALNNGINTARFIDIPKILWIEKKDEFLKKIETFECPFFIKAAHMGYNIGVERVDDRREILTKMEKVFELDDHLIVEEGVIGQEVHVAVLGNTNIEAAVSKETMNSGEFDTFEKKYKDEHFQVQVSDSISKEKIKEVQDMAILLYKLMGSSGMSRIDFFLKDGKYYFSEINPTPGFSSNGLYPGMWEKADRKIAFSDLLDRLIILAFHKKRQKANLGL